MRLEKRLRQQSSACRPLDLKGNRNFAYEHFAGALHLLTCQLTRRRFPRPQVDNSEPQRTGKHVGTLSICKRQKCVSLNPRLWKPVPSDRDFIRANQLSVRCRYVTALQWSIAAIYDFRKVHFYAYPEKRYAVTTYENNKSKQSFSFTYSPLLYKCSPLF